MCSKSISRTVKGQTAIEFVMMMAMAILMGTVFLFGVLDVIRDATELERATALNRVGYGLQDELILATQVDDGYVRTFQIPERAGKFIYTVTPLERAVLLVSGPVKITYDLPDYEGTLALGTNIITKQGTITVTQ